MACEEHALLLEFHNAFAIREMLTHLLPRKVTVELFLNSKTIFFLIAKDGMKTARRLQMNVSSMRESKQNGELARVRQWKLPN